MNLNLDHSKSVPESIDITLPVPVSTRLYEEIRQLQKKHGKKVWIKTREFLENLVKENSSEIEKAS